MQGVQVWSLVRDLRSHMWHSTPPHQKKSLKILLKVSVLMDLYFIQWTKCVAFIIDFVLKSPSQSGHREPFQDPSVLSHHSSRASLLSRLLWTFPVSVLEQPCLQGPRCHSLGGGVWGLGKFLAAGCYSFWAPSGGRAQESFCYCAIAQLLIENTTEFFSSPHSKSPSS